MSLRAQARKRLLILLAGVVVLAGLAGAGYAYHRIKIERRYAELRRRGMEAAAAGDDPAAVNFLSQYLLRYDRDEDALAAFAHSRPKVELPQNEHLKETAAALNMLLKIDPNRTEDWRSLMKLYDAFDMMTETNATADQLLSRAPGDGEALSIKVGALMRLHKYDEALATAKIRVAAAPDDWMTQMKLIRCMAELGRPPEEIIATATKATAAHPNEQGARLMMSVAYGAGKQLDKAESELMAAAKLPYKDRNVGFLLMQTLDENGTHHDAVEVLKQIAASGDTDGRRLLLRRYWEDSHLSDAAQLAATSSASTSATPWLTDDESIGIYADTLRHLNREAEADKQLAILADRKDHLVAAAWCAIEAAGANPGVETARAEADACSKAADQAQRDGYVVYYQGMAEAALGENNQALELWNKSAHLEPTWALPLLEKSQALLNQGNLDQAADAAAEATRRASDIPGPAIMLSMVWFEQYQRGSTARLGDLNALIDEIQQHVPGEEQTLRIRAVLQARAGQADKAADTIRQLLAKQPPATEKTLASLVDISRQWKLGLEDQCLKLMEEHYGRTPQSVVSEALEARRKQLAAGNSSGDDGLTVLQQAASAAPASEAGPFAQAIATYLEMTGNPGATAAWVAAGDKYTSDLNLQRAVLGSPSAYRDRAFYDRSIDRVHQLLGDQSTTWKVARARWLMDGAADAKTTSDATALLDDVLAREPESVAANVLMGQAKARAGDYDGAAARFTAAQRLDPNSPAMALDMAHLLQFRGDFEGAAEQLDKVAQNPAATGTQLAETALMLGSQGNLQKAVQVLQPVASGPHATEAVKLEMASLYCRVKDLDHAQAIADELMTHPDASAIVLTADIAMFRGQPQAADTALARLKDLTWAAGEEDRAAGDFYYQQGEYGKAAARYQAAAQAAPRNLLVWVNLMSCEGMLGDNPAIVNTVGQAIGHLPDNARLLALQKQADLIQHAGQSQTERQCVAAMITDASPTSPAVVTLRTIEETEAANVLPSEALQRMQKLSVDQPRFLPAQTALIEAQLRLGRCEDAIQSSNATVQAFPNDARPAELATDALAVFERWSEALRMAHVWRDRVIGDTSAVDLKIAQIQLRQGDTAGAEETIKPYLAATTMTPQNHWLFLLTQAQALLGQGQTDAAVQVLWPVAQSTPAARAEFMSFVASNLPPAQAAGWLSRMSDLLTSQSDTDDAQISLAGAWDMLSQRGGGAQYGQTARALAAHLEQSPKVAASAALTTAMFLQEDGDAKGAEAAYRVALGKADLPQAKNNLAMMLAERGGDLSEATELARQCVKGDSTQAVYYDTLAYILGRGKHYDEGMQAMQTAIRLQPDNAKWYVNMIKLLVGAGKTDQAKQMLAELDLMTPGVHSLPKNYLTDLDGLRRQLANSTGTVSLTP